MHHNTRLPANITFDTIADINEISATLNLLEATTGVSSLLCNPKGDIFFKTKNFPDYFIKQNELYILPQLLQNSNKENSIQITPFFGDCIFSAHFPLNLANQIVAYCYLSPIRNNQHPIEECIKNITDTESNKKTLIKLTEEMPAMPKEQLQEIARLNLTFINQYIENKYQTALSENIINTLEKQFQRLEASNKNLNDVFQTLEEGLAYTSLKGEVLAVNQRLLDILDLSKKELLGKNIVLLTKKLLTGANITKTLPLITKLVLGKTVEPFQIKYKDKTLEIKAILNKESKRITGIISDITEKQDIISQLEQTNKELQQKQQELITARENAEKSEEHIRHLIELAPDAFLHGNEEGIIIGSNNKALEITGYSKEELEGLHISKLFTPYILSAKPLNFEALKRGEVIKTEREIIKKDGQVIPIEMSSRQMPNKTYQSFMRDISERKEAENALKESERSKSVLLANLPGIAYRCLYDHDWTMKFISQGCLELTGYTPENLIDNTTITYNDLILPEYHEYLWNLWEDAVKHRKIVRVEYRILTADKKEKWVFEQGIPIYNEKGEVEALEGLIIDITDRKQMEEALKENEEKYRLLFEKSPLGVLHFNKKGIIVGANHNFSKISNIPSELLTGKSMEIFASKEITQAVHRALNGYYETFEGDYTPPRGNAVFPVRIIFSPIIKKGKTVEGGIAIIEDRSAQVMKETLEKQIAVAEEAVKFKQNFLANMSHEIRTPLTGIIGMIDIMGTTPLDDNQKDYIHTLRQSAANLREIINQILDYSKIEAGHIEIKSKAFSSIVLFEEARKLFQTICQKEVVLETYIHPRIPEFIIADKYRINQVINNLLSNAVKFTHKGKISLKAEPLFEESKDEMKIKISVQDTGIGIERDLLEKLFQPFQQADYADTRNIEGTGLGLSIARELAQLMGGEIGVDSKPGKGSTFWFTFVMKPATEAQETKSNIRTHVINKNLNILLVEDKVVNQKVISLMLESLGHNVTTANNGEHALEIFREGVFDLILMDIQMPVMNGIDATKHLKATYTNLPPIVGLSANAFEGDREKYMSQGMDEYLTKPVQKEDFEELISILF